MLREEQEIAARVWVKSYKDAYTCLQQAARKEGSFNMYRKFYTQMKNTKPAELESSRYYKLFNVSKILWANHFNPEPQTIEELRDRFNALLQSDLDSKPELKKEIIDK